MMNERLVSIITPAYNAEKYIALAIESVLAQTYTNWEMIIADDGSVDSTIDIVRQYTSKDNRIMYYKLDKNSGGAIATNKAIEKAKGSMLAFLDADDYWVPKKLEKHVKFALENGYAFTFSGYTILKDKKNKYIKVPKSQNYRQYLMNTIIGTSVVLLDLEKVGYDFRVVEVQKGFDSMTWTKLFRQGFIAYGLNESLAYYRKIATSLSNDKFESAKSHWKNCRDIERIPFFKCVWYFIGYAFNATLKHYF